MPDEAEKAAHAEAAKNIDATIAKRLREMFDAIAKTTFRAGAMCEDSNLTALEKFQQAHSEVAVLVSDAMRGLSDISFLLGSSWFISGMASSDDEGEGESATQDD